MDDRQQDKSFLAAEAYDDAAALITREHLQEHYGSHPQPWFRWVWQHLHRRPGMRWLDIGCGPAHLWWKNVGRLPAGCQVLLGDLSPGMVQAAQHNLQGAPPAFTFVVADSEWLPVATGRFDAIVALGLLDHLPNRAACLAGVRRALRPGGFFYASAGGRGHLQELDRLVRPFLPGVAYGGDTVAFGLENGAAQLRPFFRHVVSYFYEDQIVFHEVAPIVAYVRSEAGAARRLQGTLLAAFEDTLASQLASAGALVVTRQKGLFVAQL